MLRLLSNSGFVDKRGSRKRAPARRLPRWLTVAPVGLVVIAVGALGAAPDVDRGVIQRALDRGLHQGPGWHALLHYRAHTVPGWRTSEVDDPDFFFAADGKTNPRAELIHSLRALGPTKDSARPRPQCRFPARYHWLGKRLGLSELVASLDECETLQSWLAKMEGHRATLVFPASYLNSPSSMFGHTFLRIDQKDQSRDNRLLAPTINYAAGTEASDNGLLFALKGIFGGYPGVFSLVPYHEKIKLYSDLENRDIWEYQLNLKPAEVDQLLRHAWALKDTHFDYFFLDENCAYRVISLLDVARPQLALTDELSAYAIPSDTVRLTMDAGLVRETRYRPAAATRLKHKLAQLSETERRYTAALANRAPEQAPALEGLPPARRAAVLEAAYDLLRYRSLDEGSQRAMAERSYRLLSRRSRIDAPSPFESVPTPEVRDDQGHDTLRLRAGLGRGEARNFGFLQWRPAYHALVDPTAGYRPGAAIRFLDTRLRVSEDADVRLERLDAIGITSLSAVDRFFSPISWRVNVGARRLRLGGDEPLIAALDGGPGITVSLSDDAPRYRAYALAQGLLAAGDLPDESYSLGVGARLGLLRMSHAGNTHLFAQTSRAIAGSDLDLSRVQLNHQLTLSKSTALRVDFIHRLHSAGALSNHSNELKLGLVLYL